jgi:hypothetical protein
MVLRDSGLLGFWLRFGSRLRLRPMIGITRQKPKILAAHRYIFSVNALSFKRNRNRFPPRRTRLNQGCGSIVY